MTAMTHFLMIALDDLIINFSRYFIAVSAMFVLVWALKKTRLHVLTIQDRTASKADIQREILASAWSILIYLSIIPIMMFGIKMGIFQRITGTLGLATDLAILAGIVIAHDAYFYWTHRAMHHPRLFKRFHRLHHKSITPTPFAAYAFAAPEAFVAAMFIPLWQLFVATPGWVLFTFLNIMIIRNVMGHAGLELHPRWWTSFPLTRWISTTTHHDMHHSGSFNHNFGFYFTFWDKVMGTEHPDYHAKFQEITTRVGRHRRAADHVESPL